MTLNGATFEHYLFKKVAVTDALQGELIGLASTRGSTKARQGQVSRPAPLWSTVYLVMAVGETA